MEFPIYEIKLTDDLDGIQCISFVDNPAMEVEMLCFNKQTKIDFQINETEQCITSVVILCDTPIYRYDTRLGDYYITFSKDVIKEIAERFNKNGMNNIISLNHNGNEIHDKAVLRELFIKDTDKGINPTDERFTDVPNGSLFATYHILDTELFNLIKTKGGISMELLSDIKLQEYEDVDIFEYLFEEDKKKAFSVSKNTIKSILKQNKQVNIQWGAELLENQQIWGSCKVNGENGIMVYNPNNETWSTYNLKEIEVKVTDKPLVDFNYNAQWKLLINDMNIIIDSVKSTSQEGDNSLESIIENKPYVMISYFDETENPATGFRTCCVSSWGYTTKGNECIRVYEYNGDTKSGFDEGHWRLLLTRRITDLKVVDYMKPIQTAPPLYNGELQAGSGKWGTMSSVIMTAKW
jgi:hypothetical protein